MHAIEPLRSRSGASLLHRTSVACGGAGGQSCSQSLASGEAHTCLKDIEARPLRSGHALDGRGFAKLHAGHLRNSTQAISVLVFLLCMGVVLFSSALFYAEKMSCPDVIAMSPVDIAEYTRQCEDRYHRGISPSFGLCCSIDDDPAPLDFPSIIAASWWSMVTMTTVGYGEIYPRTALGKCVGCIAMLVGMVLIALPVAIVGQKFQDVYESHDFDDARNRAAARMKVSVRSGLCSRPSDVLSRLRSLKPQDAALASAVSDMAGALEEVWEERERLARECKNEMEKQKEIHQNLAQLLQGMEASLTVHS